MRLSVFFYSSISIFNQSAAAKLTKALETETTKTNHIGAVAKSISLSLINYGGLYISLCAAAPLCKIEIFSKSGLRFPPASATHHALLCARRTTHHESKRERWDFCGMDLRFSNNGVLNLSLARSLVARLIPRCNLSRITRFSPLTRAKNRTCQRTEFSATEPR